MEHNIVLRQFEPEKCPNCDTFITPENCEYCFAMLANVKGLDDHGSPMCSCGNPHHDKKWAHTCQICQEKAVLVPAVFLDKVGPAVKEIIPGVVLFNPDSKRASVFVPFGENEGDWVKISRIEKYLGTNKKKWKSFCYIEMDSKLRSFEELSKFLDWNTIFLKIGKGDVDTTCSRVKQLAMDGKF